MIHKLKLDHVIITHLFSLQLNRYLFYYNHIYYYCVVNTFTIREVDILDLIFIYYIDCLIPTNYFYTLYLFINYQVYLYVKRIRHTQ